MKPFFVTLEVVAVVMAEDETHAYEVAGQKKRDIFYDADYPDIMVGDEIATASDMRDGWDLDCIPYGGDGNTRIGEYLALEVPSEDNQGETK